MVEDKESRLRLLQFYEANLEFGRKTQSEHSRWIINTLYLLHSGAIVGLLSKLPPDKIHSFVSPLTWFVIGLCFAFLTALATWINYDCFVRTFRDLAVSIRFDQSVNVDGPPKTGRLVDWTHWGALAVGLASFACFVFGTIAALARLTLLTANQ